MIKQPLIKTFSTQDELSEFFALMLKESIENKPDGAYFTMALSGGTTPKGIFKYLTKYFTEEIDWSSVKIFWGDERCVPPNSSESNYKMARDSLLKYIHITDNQIFRINGEDDPIKECKRYTDIVKGNVSLVDGVPVFDFILLGLGEDGHTASIFPENIHLFNSDSIYEVSKNPYIGQKRITATGKIINNAKNVIFLVTGYGKSEMVAKILQNNIGADLLPASLVNPSGKLLWLMDEEAGSKVR